MTELAIFGVMFLLIIGVISLIAWWGERAERVKRSADESLVIMSRAEIRDLVHAASSVSDQTRQTPDQTEDAAAKREKMLDTYRRLRLVGMSRDDARALLKPWGIPLDNNLWSKAAPPPPEEPQQVTPIAGRPTSAQFHDDSDLIFQPPPR